MLVPPEIPDNVVKEIAEGYASREINRVLTTLNTWSPSMSKLTLPQKNAGAMLAYFAWAMDMSPTFVPIVEDLVQRFKKEISRSSMTLCDLVYLNMAEGLLNLHYEQYEEAISNFNLAEFGATHADNNELQIIAKYYLGRSYLKTANYRMALSYIQGSKTLDLQPKRAAVTQSIEGLLHLLLGEVEEAEPLFDEAEVALRGNESDNAEVHGNLCMFRARIKRRKGQYTEAAEKFKEGIEFYEKRDKHHRNVARACVHLAVIGRIQALSLEKEIHKQDGVKEKMKSYWNEAHEYLARAEMIYNLNPERHAQGLAKVHITRALLYLDMGIYHDERYNEGYFGYAERAVSKASRLGSQKHDNLVLSKARTIQCRLALLGQHKERDLRALKLANEAVAYAEKTDHPRLKARAYIWQGQARLNVLQDPLAAEQCLRAASHLLSPEDQDSLRDEFNELREDIGDHSKPTKPIVELRLSDLIKPISNDIEKFIIEARKSRGKKNSQEVKDHEPEAKCYLRQIMDQVEEDVIRYLYGFMGSVNQVQENWHINRLKVSGAISTYVLTKSSLRELAGRLNDDVLKDTLDRKEKSLANKKKPAQLKKQLAQLRAEILKELAKLEDQEVLVEANFIGLLSKAIGYRRAVALKPVIIESLKERD